MKNWLRRAAGVLYAMPMSLSSRRTGGNRLRVSGYQFVLKQRLLGKGGTMRSKRCSVGTGIHSQKIGFYDIRPLMEVMNMSKRNSHVLSKIFFMLFTLLIAELFQSPLSIVAFGAPYPEKTIQLFVVTSPGSGQDVFARKIAQIGESKTYFGKSLRVVNVPGGGGVTGVAKALKEPADGYTLIIASNMIPLKAATKELTTDIAQFEYICRMVQDPFIIAVRSDSKFKTINDLMKEARENPGKILMAGGLVAATQHIAALSFLRGAKLDMRWVPFDGQGDVVMALLGGHADAMHGNPGIVFPHVKAGKLLVLATSNPERLRALPEAVTYKELGIKPAFEGIWRGIMAKKGLPEDVTGKLGDIFHRIVKEPEFVKFVEDANAEIKFESGDKFRDSVLDEYESYRQLLKQLGITK